MQVKDRAAYESLRIYYHYLTSALQPDDILGIGPSLFSSGLISSVQMQAIMHEKGPNKGCMKLLDILMSNGSEGAFNNFLDVLRKLQHLKYLVPELQSEFNFTFSSSNVMQNSCEVNPLRPI